MRLQVDDIAETVVRNTLLVQEAFGLAKQCGMLVQVLLLSPSFSELKQAPTVNHLATIQVKQEEDKLRHKQRLAQNQLGWLALLPKGQIIPGSPLSPCLAPALENTLTLSSELTASFKSIE
ncbi:hypothetical protein AOLI_G00266640 [Acnodon oligacanthus]